MANSNEKALVKRFCEKNFTEFLARVEKMVSIFLSSTITSVRIDDFFREIKIGKKNGGERVTLLRVHLLTYFTLKVLDYQKFIPVFFRKYMRF